jgi:hypothetical protein
MTLRYGLLCFLAAFIIFLLVLKNFDTWTSPPAGVKESREAPAPGPKPEVSQPAPALQEQDEKAAISSFIFISEKNLFHPERKEFPIVAPEPPKEVKKPVVRPQVTLYGVMIAGEQRSASISYPRTLQKGEREVFSARIGDKVGEYKVAKISEDRIELEAPGDGFEVLLFDSKTPKRRVDARTVNKPAAITSTVAGPPAPEAPKPGAPSPVVGAPERPAGVIQERVIEAPAPRGVSPALMPVPSTVPAPPSPRTRRWEGGTRSP